MPKILHIFNFEEKFSKPFFQFLQDNDFDLKQHQLFHYGKNNPDYKKFNMKFTFAHYYSVIKHMRLLSDMFKSKQIIVHSLASPWLLLYLYLFPSLTKKVYWVIWGKDLYFFKLLEKKRFYHHIYEYFRRKVFKNIKHVVTCVPGDALLAKQWYRTEAKCHECIMYPSNLFKNVTLPEKEHIGFNILLGNSADPSNNHLQILNKLKIFIDKDITIYSPLSYGDKKNCTHVIKEGKQAFGNKFIPLTDFLVFEDYLNLLGKIDIAIFGHKRQQAMGNTITLLGLGKTIYMDPETTSWDMFQRLNIIVFDNKNIKLRKLSVKQQSENIKNIKHYFSKTIFIKQLKELFLNSLSIYK